MLLPALQRYMMRFWSLSVKIQNTDNLVTIGSFVTDAIGSNGEGASFSADGTWCPSAPRQMGKLVTASQMVQKVFHCSAQIAPFIFARSTKRAKPESVKIPARLHTKESVTNPQVVMQAQTAVIVVRQSCVREALDCMTTSKYWPSAKCQEVQSKAICIGLTMDIPVV